MNSRVLIRLQLYCCLIFALIPAFSLAEGRKGDAFLGMVQEMVQSMPGPRSGLYAVPTDAELRDWTVILSQFTGRSFDSCRALLAKYDYELTVVHDRVTGNTYEVIRERAPIRRGWGTYVYNGNFKKRLSIHVNHPVDDGNAAVVGAELFRRLGAQWMLVAGTNKNASTDYAGAADVGKTARSVFQRWHELLADPAHVALSVHGYHSPAFAEPIRSSDVVISNGRTSDDQWGISRLSLSFRDSVSLSGFRCSLAMYDSGCARLAGGGNPQGVFSNDNTGFGHWINLELSERVRYVPAQYLRLIAAADRALVLIGRKVPQLASRDFGLVSPRVVRIDSLRRMLFPVVRADNYKIVSFQASENGTDSAHVVFGGWLNFGDGQPVTRLIVDSSSSGDFARAYRAARRKTASQVTRVVEGAGSAFPPDRRLANAVFADSNAEDDAPVREPIQVHRIPLQAVLVSTMMNETYSPASTAFKWEGSVSDRFIPGLRSFQMASGRASETPELRGGIPSFLIPLLRNSYDADTKRFVGVQMTSILVNEIARLVNEHNVNVDEVRLFAEESTTGDYFLRIFPAPVPGTAIVQNTP